MKFVWYFLAFILGAFGLLSAARTVERLIAGIGILPAQVCIAIVALGLAWKCVQKARQNLPDEDSM